ncbi:MAG: hypothetical protein KME17_26805 [Cyanosarcina radialis HA8281-LM2]|jgi:hypothetical protein|nr:hypothetical protein [Cyanosarcina radialis HA8281-LM2]
MSNASITASRNNIGVAIFNAIDFLKCEQLNYGEFKTYLSIDKTMKSDSCTFDGTPFTTALVLYSLKFVEDPRVSEMTQKAIQFLVEERERGGVWRFWSSKNPRNKLCPPDLDVTACIAYVLKQHYSPLLYSFLFGSNLNIFLNCRNDRGLFYTFISPNLPRNPIDSGVNANALLYLGECEETKPICDYLNDLVLSDREKGSDRWYAETALYYFISRAYFQGASSLKKSQNVIVEKTLALQLADGYFGNDLNTALAVCTLLNYQYSDRIVLERAIHSILERQGENGAWSRIPLWSATPEVVWGGEASDWPVGFWGSEELTTAFSIEALARYQQQLEMN